jgi:hypothetical protein
MTESFENTTLPTTKEKSPQEVKVEKLKSIKDFIGKNFTGDSLNLFYGIHTQEEYEKKSSEVAKEIDNLIIELQNNELKLPRLSRKLENVGVFFKTPHTINRKDELVREHQSLIYMLGGLMDVVDDL